MTANRRKSSSHKSKFSAHIVHFLFNTGAGGAEKEVAEFVLEADSRQRLQTPQLHFSEWIRKRFPAPPEFKSSLIYADRDHHDINELDPPKHEKLGDILFIMQLDVIFYKMYSLVLCFSTCWHLGNWFLQPSC